MFSGFQRYVGWLLTATVLLALLPWHGSLGAADPLIRFEELMAGANGDSRIQFITISATGARATCWGPQVAPGTPGADGDDSLCYAGGANETRSRTALVFFDSEGRETGRYKFPENPSPVGTVAQPSRPNRTGGAVGTAIPRTPGANAILIATEAFAQLAGAPAPDFIMPPMLAAISGKVCFVDNRLENPNASPINLCVSYGAFSGDTEGAGAPAAALTTVDTVSLRRTTNDFANRNASFSRSNVPSPSNRAGQTLRIPVASRPAQGEALFRRETFGGNGRTCGECHPSSDSGRLTPAEVQARFRGVAATFDPLFIAETAATGFDFNLNTLTIATRPVPASGTDFLNASGGDLRGVVTSSSGARAKVLARTSPTTYLVYGGLSPARLSGTIADEAGNTAAIIDVTQGSLNGLEQPVRMRTSRSPAFPEGRALILENLEGFENPPVFRKSPHILNLSRTAPFGFDGRSPNLRSFTLDAVRQHFPRTLARSDAGPNPDFRMPTPEELEAMEAFQLAQEFPTGTDPAKFNLDRFLTTPAQQRGRTVFFGIGKCVFCHGGTVLATTTVNLLGQGIGVNGRFDTGVVRQPINGAGVDNLPCEPSVGACGTREFSVPSLFNIRNHAPFFHDGSAATLRDAVNFYNSAQFALSPGGRAVGGIIVLGQPFEDLIAFLEAISAPGPTTLTSNDRLTVPATSGPPSTADSASGLPAAFSATGSATARTTDGVRLTATEIVRGLSDPTDLAVGRDGRIFIAERAGRIRVVRGGRLLPAPVLSVPEFDARDGAGVLTIALDPDFPSRSFLYALYTASTGYQLARFRVVGDTAAERAVLIDRIGASASRPSVVLRFGPDRALYVAVDDGDDARAVRDPGSFNGKVLRLNADATTPHDQVGGNPVYVMDLHAPLGLDWDGRGRLWIVEPDEASAFIRIDAAAQRAARVAGYRLSQATQGTGLVVYRSARVPQLQDNLLIGSFDGRGLLRIRAGRDSRRGMPADEWLLRGVMDSIRALAATADGTIYLATADALVRVDAQPDG